MGLISYLSITRLGFLGTLHMDVFRQRLSDEYGSQVIVTRPFVPLKREFCFYSWVVLSLGLSFFFLPIYFEFPWLLVVVDGKEKLIDNPVDFPASVGRGRMSVLERIVVASIVVPDRYTGAVIELCAVSVITKMTKSVVR